MRVPYSELGRFVKVEDIDPAELVEKLNRHSVEATLTHFGNTDLEGVKVARVLDVKPHPELKKLLVCRVDAGGEILTVCTNDRSVKEGELLAVAPPGARVGEITVERRNFKGVVSEGMFLGGEDLVGIPTEGVFRLPPKAAAPGEDVIKLLSIGEPIIELDITPNRGDLLSVKGLAREVCAIYDRPMNEPPVEDFEAGGKMPPAAIEDRGCSRYRLLLLEGLEIKESPLWLKLALWKFGERDINAAVDATNYAMFLEGNPLHAFDADKIEGRISVRSAREGERFLALNGKEYELKEGDLVIADEKKILALAGIIGGAESAVSPSTTRILLEGAHFDPFRIRKTAKRLDLRTESSYRFERNVDVENVARAQNLAAAVILRLSGGRAVGKIDLYPEPYRPPRVTLRLSEYEATVGEGVDPREAAKILKNLGFSARVRAKGLSEEALRRTALRLAAERLGCRRFLPEAVNGSRVVISCGGKRAEIDLDRETELLKEELKRWGVEF